VIGWLTRLVVVLGTVAVVAFDAISIGITSVTLSDHGHRAAREGAEAWQMTADVQRAYDAALRTAQESNDANEVLTEDFTIAATGVVTLTIVRTPSTLLAQHIGPLRERLTMTRTESGSTYDGTG
jgi:hypothetical protein